MNTRDTIRSNALPLLLSLLCLLPSIFWQGQLRISLCTAIIVFAVIRISAKMRNKRTEQIRKLSLIARNATNSMIILNSEGMIEWVNTPFTMLTGYGLEEVMGKRPQDFLHGPQTNHTTRREIIASVAQGKAFTGEIVNYHKNGSTFWLRISISPVFEKNKLVNLVSIQTDITHIKKQNQHLRDIAFAISHRFRKPLANILGLINEMEYTYSGSETLGLMRISADEMDRELRYIVHKTAVVDGSVKKVIPLTLYNQI